MSSPTSPTRPPTTRSDREFFAELWGSTPAGRRRRELLDLRRRAGAVALLATMLLIAQVGFGAIVPRETRIASEPAGAEPAPRPVADQEPSAGAPAAETEEMGADDPVAPMELGRVALTVVFDTDGATSDDALAQTVLQRYEEQGLVEVVVATDTTADPATALRDALAAADDYSVVIVTTGSATNLAALLTSPGDDSSPVPGRSLVAAKVRLLVTVAPDFARSSTGSVAEEANLVYADWPTPVIAVEEAAGAVLELPGDGPTHALAAVLHTVEAEQGYFMLSEPGRLAVDDDGDTTFTASIDGWHHLLIAPAGERTRTRILDRYIELLGAGS